MRDTETQLKDFIEGCPCEEEAYDMLVNLILTFDRIGHDQTMDQINMLAEYIVETKLEEDGFDPVRDGWVGSDGLP